MRINTNMAALNAWRIFSGTSQSMERTMERLSSGQRINRAADDPAGLAISENMRAQIRSMSQSMRNIQDGISLVRATEGTLQEVTQMLQRGRELSIQAANGVWTPEEKTSIQNEISNIVAEVDRIASTAEFNGRPLLGGSGQEVGKLVESLRRSWLAPAEDLVRTGYGLQADDVPIKIVIDPNGSHPAFVFGTVAGTGQLTNLELHVNLAMFNGMSPDYADRIIAHEMTHAVMARSMNFAALPTWFKEGAAEFIAGADDRVAADLAANGNNVAALVGEIDTWEGNSIDYSAGYTAVKFLDAESIATGKAGMKDVIARLKAGDTLDAAIAFATNGNYADAATFIAAYKSGAGGGGQDYIQNVMTLNDADVGAIGGGTGVTTVPNVDVDTWNPLVHFTESWPDMPNPLEPVVLHVGPMGDHSLELPNLQTNSYLLGLTGVDVVKNASGAIDVFGKAITTVSGIRAELGAVENRLEHTYNINAINAENLTASESKIRDADMALEMATLTRQQLLIQSSAAMMAQANSVRRDAVQALIR